MAHQVNTSQWDETRQLGQIFICGFEGTEVNTQVKALIERFNVGSILLAPKNLKSAEQATKLILDLQTIARAAGHQSPLLIAVDQENGGVNSLFDEAHVRQYPSNMGVAATGSKSLAKQIAKATAQELRSIGVNLILGPVLDVITDAHSQPLGARSFGDDPHEVSSYGLQFVRGYREARVASCGKHFPSFEKLELLRETMASPTGSNSLSSPGQTSLIPFRDAINEGVDAILVGDVAVKSSDLTVMHACLSERIVDGLLRKEMRFGGVVVSECLELSLSDDIGVQGAAVMAVRAGCDLIMVCRSPAMQEEAMTGLSLGLENGMIEASRLQESVTRIAQMKSKCTSWKQALNPDGVPGLTRLRPSHRELSSKAYSKSITVVRDEKHNLPLFKNIGANESVLLLTPLLTPLPASASFHALDQTGPLSGPHANHASHVNHASHESVWLSRSAENLFRRFGASLSKRRHGELEHTSYSAHGVQPRHEVSISRAAAVIVITGDVNRNKYQSAFAKHVQLLCRLGAQAGFSAQAKPCIVVAVSSPYDFAVDPMIETYICTYDYTETALEALVNVICGDIVPTGKLPEAVIPIQKINQARQQWLVENFNEERDATSLDILLDLIRRDQHSPSALKLSGLTSKTFVLYDENVRESHFVVRNSSTKELFGFCATYYFPSSKIGHVALILVDPHRQRQSVGHSLHARAIRALAQNSDLEKIQLGSPIPSILLGLPLEDKSIYNQLCKWFSRLGWSVTESKKVCRVMIEGLGDWRPKEGLAKSLNNPDLKYEIVQGGQEHVNTILEHVRRSSPELETLYQLSLASSSGGVIRAKSLQQGRIMGTLLVCRRESSLISCLPAIGGSGGALLAPVTSSADESSTALLQSLILLGIRYFRKQGATSVLLDVAHLSEAARMLRSLGLERLQVLEFDVITSDAAKLARVMTA